MTLEEQLLRDEGYRQFPYRDSFGKLTVGIGRNLDDLGISEEEARYLLSNDIERARHQLSASLPWYRDLDPVRQAVLENMNFNLGHSGLLKFRKMLEAAEKGQHHIVSQHMLDSLWAKQTGARASRLAEQWRTGEWV